MKSDLDWQGNFLTVEKAQSIELTWNLVEFHMAWEGVFTCQKSVPMSLTTMLSAAVLGPLAIPLLGSATMHSIPVPAVHLAMLACKSMMSLCIVSPILCQFSDLLLRDTELPHLEIYKL